MVAATSIYTFIVVFCLLAGEIEARIVVNQEVSLLKFLLEKYESLSRPVKQANGVVLVSLDIRLKQLLEVNVDGGWIILTISTNMEWVDYNLQWRPTDFGNISNIKMPIHRIWQPDILTLNFVGSDYSPNFRTKTIIRANGSVAYSADYTIATSCRFNEGNMEQSCDLTFGSWTHNDDEIFLVMSNDGGGDISSVKPNKVWEILGMPVSRIGANYLGDGTPRGIITYQLKIKNIGNATSSP